MSPAAEYNILVDPEAARIAPGQRLCPVDVECAGELTTGMTVVDWLRQTGRARRAAPITACG